MSGRDFERLAGERVFDGHIVHVDRDRFRYPGGEEVEREIVRHPGAVGIVPVDDEHVWLVRQPREAAGDPDSLEIPAGKLDAPDEEPLETGRRELAEEIGMGAETWEPMTTFFTSLGVMDERIHLFLATGLSPRTVDPPEHDERIEVVRWPLDRLDEAIAETRDAKTLIGLLLLARRRGA